MNDKDLRELALLVLDDENGISEEAFNKLSSLLEDIGCADILVAVDSSEGRFYIGEDFAEEKLKELREQNFQEKVIQDFNAILGISPEKENE